MSDNRPIGVFDSGVGGLTVLRELRLRLPNEDFIYLGDMARLPYGTKSRETLTEYTVQAARLLLDEEIKLLVVACNTASALALEGLRSALPRLPAIGVVEAGAKAAIAASSSGGIVVMSTESTARSCAYPAAIASVMPDAEVHPLACNLLVSLAEEGWLEGLETRAVVKRYLDALSGIEFDTVVLGCTHFPLLAATIKGLLPENVAVVDGSAATAMEVAKRLTLFDALNSSPQSVGNTRFMVTDSPERFARLAKMFMPEMAIGEIESVAPDLSHLAPSHRKAV